MTISNQVSAEAAGDGMRETSATLTLNSHTIRAVP
jgi:hypothetical protein